MRDDSDRTDSVLDDLSSTATASDQSGSYGVSVGATDGVRDVEREVDELIERVNNVLPAENVQLDESIIKDNLDEVLLMLIALHGEAHGKELLSNLADFFGVQLSPGTVYPALHKLEEEDVLSMHAKVRTKEYSIADENLARATLERAMVQHLAFGLLLYSFSPRL